MFVVTWMSEHGLAFDVRRSRRPSYAFVHCVVDGSDEIVPRFVRTAKTESFQKHSFLNDFPQSMFVAGISDESSYLELIDWNGKLEPRALSREASESCPCRRRKLKQAMTTAVLKMKTRVSNS